MWANGNKKLLSDSSAYTQAFGKAVVRTFIKNQFKGEAIGAAPTFEQVADKLEEDYERLHQSTLK